MKLLLVEEDDALYLGVEITRERANWLLDLRAAVSQLPTFTEPGSAQLHRPTAIVVPELTARWVKEINERFLRRLHLLDDWIWLLPDTQNLDTLPGEPVTHEWCELRLYHDCLRWGSQLDTDTLAHAGEVPMWVLEDAAGVARPLVTNSQANAMVVPPSAGLHGSTP